MENKINIAEILRDMPKGTKLYSPLFGKCELVDTYTDEDGDFILVECGCQEEDIAESNRLKLREKILTEASVLLGMGSFSHKITDEDVQAIYNIINKYR